MKIAKLSKGRSLKLKQNLVLYAMILPVLAFYLIFKYFPMAGLVIAFKNYNFTDGMFGSPWVGWRNFEILFSSSNTVKIIWNTFWLSFLKLAVGFPMPIILALMINEVGKTWFKKSIQTIVYLPHFFSWVIVAGFVLTLFATDNGTINNLLARFGVEENLFLYQAKSWITIFVGAGIWKEMGYECIIYLAALTAIDPSLYEAADMDGATKFRKIWHITIPGILPTIILLLILAMGKVMEVGFDQVYNLQNQAVSGVSEVISTYVYKMGLQNGQFSLSTAMGLFESVIAFVLVISVNQIARKFDQGLF